MDNIYTESDMMHHSMSSKRVSMKMHVGLGCILSVIYHPYLIQCS